MGQACSCGAGRPRKDRPGSPVEPRPPPLENVFYGGHPFADRSNLLPINEAPDNILSRAGLAVPKVANADTQALVDRQAVTGGRLPLSSGKHDKHHKSGDKVRFGSSSGLGDPTQLDRQLIDREALERQGVEPAKLDRAALDREAHSRQPREDSLGLDPNFMAQLVANDPGPRHIHDHGVGAVHHTKPDEIVHLDTKVAGSHDLHSDVATPPIRTALSRLHDLTDDVRVPSSSGIPAALHNLHADAKTLPPRLNSPAHDLHRDIRAAPVRTTSSPSHGIHTDPVVGSVIGSSKPHLLKLDHKDDDKSKDLIRSASQDGASETNDDSPEQYRARKSKTRSRRSNMRSSEMSSDGAMDPGVTASLQFQQHQQQQVQHQFQQQQHQQVMQRQNQAAINMASHNAAAAQAHNMMQANAAHAASQGAIGGNP